MGCINKSCIRHNPYDKEANNKYCFVCAWLLAVDLEWLKGKKVRSLFSDKKDLKEIKDAKRTINNDIKVYIKVNKGWEDILNFELDSLIDEWFEYVKEKELACN